MEDCTKGLTLRQSFALMLKGEPEKSLIKGGIRTTDGLWTKEGWELFKDYLLSVHAEEFLAKVVRPLIEERDGKKS